MLSQGVGKTMILQAFAEMLGYRRMTVFCFKERITIRKAKPGSPPAKVVIHQQTKKWIK